MLLILGQSGIGKSTLITWIIANMINNRDDVFVYQFASDLKIINWNSDNILIEILNSLSLKSDDLENKTLILDGFDEISAGDDGEDILNRLYQNFNKLNTINKFTFFITCRENYLLEIQKIECDYITLQTWDSEQIQSFCKIYSNKNMSNVTTYTLNKILENREILGTPLILYMVLALNIIIKNSGSIVDIYDRIFSLEGGSIYDRCVKSSNVKSLRFADPHRISKFKQQIHETSKRIAFWMFENEPEEIFIPKKEYEKICSNVVLSLTNEKDEEIKHDFLIGNYYKLTKYIEGSRIEKLHFVHRSIYEYFVADYIFKSICDMKSTKKIAGKFGKILIKGSLSKQILKFIKYKFDNYQNNNISNNIMKIFQIMLKNGMTYFTNEKYNRIIDKEINIFSNMLKIVFLWNKTLGQMNRELVTYLQYNNQSELELEGINLENENLNRVYLESVHMNGAVLNGINMQEACLRGARLIGAFLENAVLNEAKLDKADLSKANLVNAHLNKAHINEAELIGTRLIKAELIEANLKGSKLNYAELNGANLRGACIEDIELKGAHLRNTIFDEKQIEILEKKYDLNSSRVYIFETDKIISYKEYRSKQ